MNDLLIRRHVFSLWAAVSYVSIKLSRPAVQPLKAGQPRPIGVAARPHIVLRGHMFDKEAVWYLSTALTHAARRLAVAQCLYCTL